MIHQLWRISPVKRTHIGRTKDTSEECLEHFLLWFPGPIRPHSVSGWKKSLVMTIAMLWTRLTTTNL